MKFHVGLSSKGKERCLIPSVAFSHILASTTDLFNPGYSILFCMFWCLSFVVGFPFKYGFSMSAIRWNSFGNACHNKTISGQISLDKTHQLLAVGFWPGHPTTLTTTSFFCNKEKHVDSCCCCSSNQDRFFARMPIFACNYHSIFLAKRTIPFKWHPIHYSDFFWTSIGWHTEFFEDNAKKIW